MKLNSACLTGCALAIYLLSLTACSEVERLELSDAKLEGKITYKGKPVPYALVIVSASDGMAATGNADEQGKYVVDHAPVGEVRIGVNTDAGRGNMMGAMMAAGQGDSKGPKPVFVDLPKKFFEPTTSGITTTVKGGEPPDTFDIKIDG